MLCFRLGLWIWSITKISNQEKDPEKKGGVRILSQLSGFPAMYRASQTHSLGQNRPHKNRPMNTYTHPCNHVYRETT